MPHYVQDSEVTEFIKAVGGVDFDCERLYLDMIETAENSQKELKSKKASRKWTNLKLSIKRVFKSIRLLCKRELPDEALAPIDRRINDDLEYEDDSDDVHHWRVPPTDPDASTIELIDDSLREIQNELRTMKTESKAWKEIAESLNEGLQKTRDSMLEA